MPSLAPAVTSRAALDAWLAGEPAVVVANLVEYAEELFGPAVVCGTSAPWLDSVAEYSSVCTLLAPNPALLVLPRPAEDWVLDMQAELLNLERRPPVLAGVGRRGSACREILGDDRLLTQVADACAPMLAWSATGPFHELEDRLVGGDDEKARCDAVVRSTAMTYESKVNSHRLFRELATEHEGIRVPAQDHPRSVVDWVRILTQRRREGVRVIAKAEYGQAGHGSRFVGPDATVPVSDLVRDLLASDARLRTARPIVEEAIEPHYEHPHLTVDLLTLGPGDVVLVGVGEMIIDETHYEGVTVGPSVVPGPLAEVSAGFGRAVGARLSHEGYVGWYCVDLIHGRDGSLWPTEINVRMTGSAFPQAVRRSLCASRGRDLVIRCHDHHPLGRRCSAKDVRARVGNARKIARADGVDLVPTIAPDTTAARPTIGLLLAAESVDAIDAFSQSMASWLDRDRPV